MTRCQHCHAQTQNYLCTNCETTLANNLADLPWLLDELDTRIRKQDRTATTDNSRTSRPDHRTVIDFDAARLARDTHALLQQWVKTVAERHTGRRIPTIRTARTKHLAAWLYVHLSAATALDCAGRLYTDIQTLTGTTTEPGTLHKAINRPQRHFAGPCPTIRGYHHNDPQPCGRTLYADADQQTITCPDCEQPINVEQNRIKTAIERDLLPEPKLLEVLHNLGEHVPRVTFYRWVRELRIRPKGWIHNGQFTNHFIRRGDPAVYSLSRARKLRAQGK